MDDCGCGRSPNGKCIGWHSLSEEEYQEKLKEYEENTPICPLNNLGVNWTDSQDAATIYRCIMVNTTRTAGFL